MSTLTVATVKSNSSSPPAFQNTSGTEVGTLCRAWVNFNGTGTVAIRSQFNVSSITDNGTGSYTVTFTTAMPDANYCACFGGGQSASISWPRTPGFTATTTTLDVNTTNAAGTNVDQAHVSVAIFR